VRVDFESIFNKLVPENEPYLTHTLEGPDDMPAHIKAALVGSSVTIPISNGALNLGTWQGIYLCELFHPRLLVFNYSVVRLPVPPILIDYSIVFRQCPSNPLTIM